MKSEFATVTRLDRRTRKLTVQIDGQEKAVTFSLEKFDALRLGYAAPCTHPGDDGRRYFVLFGGGMQSREMTYVQNSSVRGECHLFADRQARRHSRTWRRWCVAPTRNRRPTRLTARRITAGRSDATSSRPRSSSPCNRPVKIEASTPGGDGHVHHESAGRSEDPRSRSAHGERCRYLIQACLREEEWRDCDREFYLVLREESSAVAEVVPSGPGG